MPCRHLHICLVPTNRLDRVPAAAAAGQRAHWSSLSSLSDARDCLGCEVVVEVVGPVRVAALRVPRTDVLSILVNNFMDEVIMGVVAGVGASVGASASAAHIK